MTNEANSPGPAVLLATRWRMKMTIGELEKQAGITDRTAFWMQFAHIKGSVKVGRLMRDASFEAGVAELRRLASQQPAA